MNHLVLLGDSIFDNAAYVSGDAVLDHLRNRLPSDWRASLFAVDGDITPNVVHRLRKVPADATHFAISVGGNDAIRESGLLQAPASSAAEALSMCTDIRKRFAHAYSEMLDGVLALGKPTLVCTVYDAIPGLDENSVTALGLFNEVILREAFRRGLSVLDLRLICSEMSDYSTVSPIEPSESGGEKIAHALADAMTGRLESRSVSQVIGASEV